MRSYDSAPPLHDSRKSIGRAERSLPARFTEDRDSFLRRGRTPRSDRLLLRHPQALHERQGSGRRPFGDHLFSENPRRGRTGPVGSRGPIWSAMTDRTDPGGSAADPHPGSFALDPTPSTRSRGTLQRMRTADIDKPASPLGPCSHQGYTGPFRPDLFGEPAHCESDRFTQPVSNVKKNLAGM